MPKTYTVKEVAQILGYSTNSIYTFLKEKRIKGVRVGKGRFRISEEEVSRLLSSPKKSNKGPVAATVPDRLPVSAELTHINDELVIERAEREVFALGKTRVHLTPPNIFDWFVGLSAITSGVGLFVFNISYEPETSLAFVAFLPAVISALITSGIGVLVSRMLGKGGWHRVFLGALVVLGFANARMFAVAGDYGAMVLYGALALVIGAHAWFHTGGIVSLGIYLTMLIVAMPFVVYFCPTDAHVVEIIKILGCNPTQMLVIATIVSFVIVVSFWTGYRYSRPLFWVSSIVVSLATLTLSVLHTYLMYWSRGYFIMTIAVFAAILPMWRMLQEHGNIRQRVIMHAMFAGIGALLICTVIAVRLLQMNVWERYTHDIRNKTEYAVSLMEDVHRNVQRSLVSASTNPVLVEALIQNDIETLNGMAKVLLESNADVRRIVILDSEGRGVLLYPHGSFDRGDLSDREYFREVKQTRRPYVSNSFQAAADQQNRYVVVVAVPIQTDEGDFAGALLGSLHMDRMGVELQRLVIGSQFEYVLVTDSLGQRIIDPDSENIGKIMGVSEWDGQARDSETVEVTQQQIEGGKIGLATRARVSEAEWIVSIRAPISNAYRLRLDTSIILGFIVAMVISIIISSMAVVHRQVEMRVRSRESG